jgi:predicted CXXCH cytochrome family protein
MGVPKLVTLILATVFVFTGPPVFAASQAQPAAAATPETAGKPAESPLANIEPAVCLGCHGNKGFSMPGADGKPRDLYVNGDKFGKSVHGKRLCVECHKDITEIPHQKGVTHKVSCVQCHEKLWDEAKKENKTAENPRLGVVVEQINRYMNSIHARPSREDQSHTNATCYNCHDAHYVYPKGSPERAEWRLNIPNICGKCHTKERAEYATSVHGKEVLENQNPVAAICSDCHSTHDVEDPAKDSTRLAITKNCGNCHSDNLKTYTDTYHGQVNKLGYAHTAKCFDCHGSHTIKRVSDPQSSMYPANRVETCKKCHQNATAGFATFEPHGTAKDFERYPQIWIASKFMIGLLAGTFAFFWTHTALWFYREYKDRQQRKTRPSVMEEALPAEAKGKFYQRFPLMWRIAHLLFALSVMTLVLTGMAVFYAGSDWAPVVMRFFGGPKVTAVLHRIAATIFVSIFLGHLVYVVWRIAKDWKNFKIFGPYSMVPSWQDMVDIVRMFKWFVGEGPRPVFDRWTYWEKFDYWAPFWGVAIIGFSGLMLWFPTITGAFLPGWVFNVATIFHGEEALLAALFLFTVHFFNNHFRPDKFPLDVVMFTGAVSLEEFSREHTIEYKRLVETGELKKYLVDAPARPMALGARILGFTLIGIGLMLLIMVVTGFIGSMMAAG